MRIESPEQLRQQLQAANDTTAVPPQKASGQDVAA
jgi:hypothetical protein